MKIAIDGYAGSGKSSLAQILAKRLDCKILNTGAIFRALAVGFLDSGAKLKESTVKKFLNEANLEVKFINGAQHMILNGVDVTKRLGSEDVAMLASKISAFAAVRDKYIAIAKTFASENNCIMEGRDIGTVVLPDADVKIFLTADEKIRAKRRFDEAVCAGQNVTYDDILADLKRRDLNDTTRKLSPLKPTDDALIVDNSALDLDHTADFCFALIKDKIHQQKFTSITFDGYVCSGKSTIAKAVAKKLGYDVFDTGAIYRGIACAFVYMGLDETKINEKYMQAFAKQINLSIYFSNGVEHVLVNGIDHTRNLRTEKTSALAAKISPFMCIRKKVLSLQREFASNHDICMEGRDIGSYVLPHADFKFFCTADENVRAQRRYEQQRNMGNDVTYEEVLKELHQRDYADVHREHGALKMCKDSIVIDTTNQTLEESVDFCLQHILKDKK